MKTYSIHLTVVAYALADDLFRLYETTRHPDLCWHLFLHSRFPDVVAATEKLAREAGVYYYPFGVNHGLARSWNDGLFVSQRAGAEVCLIANDDAFCADGDVVRLADAALKRPDAALVTGRGTEARTGETRKDMRWSLCAVPDAGLRQVGALDENFTPIYFEDTDWERRARLLGLPFVCLDSTDITHAGSQSRFAVPADHAHHDRTYPLNEAYYRRKWGGAPGMETYPAPFNDPALGLHIAWDTRHAPYGVQDRTDREDMR